MVADSATVAIATHHAQSYDVVIVGAGPSACGLLYGLLRRHIDETCATTNHRSVPLPYTIAILDRGSSSAQRTTSNSTRNPLDWFKASHYESSSRSPSLQTTPQNGLGRRILSVPLGTGFGGSTNINACLASIPSSSDFKTWPKPFRGDAVVSAATELAEVLRSNNALEEVSFQDVKSSKSEGESSLMPTRFPSFVSRVATTSRSNRCKSNNDEVEHERVNYFDGLVSPLLYQYPHLKKSVKLLEGVDAQRIIFDENEDGNDGNGQWFATGVECTTNSSSTVHHGEFKRLFITVRKHLVISAGALISPALLMVSGIGPADVLISQGISPLSSSNSSTPLAQSHREVKRRWEGVGLGLSDHIILPRAFLTMPNMWQRKSVSGIQCWYNRSIIDAKNGDRLYQLALTDGQCSKQIIPHFISSLLWHGYSWEGATTISTMAFLSCRWMLSFLMKWSPIGFIVSHCTATINVSLLNPLSRGSVTILRRRGGMCIHDGWKPQLDDFDIIVDPKYLSVTHDVAAMTRGLHLSEDIKSKSFISCPEILPGAIYRSFLPSLAKVFVYGRFPKDWIFRFASDFVCPYFHWNGTCCMKQFEDSSDETAHVVDSDFKVSGTTNVRICDASVFPSNISCHPALTCASLGYIASGSIHSESARTSNSQQSNKV